MPGCVFLLRGCSVALAFFQLSSLLCSVFACQQVSLDGLDQKTLNLIQTTANGMGDVTLNSTLVDLAYQQLVAQGEIPSRSGFFFMRRMKASRGTARHGTAAKSGHRKQQVAKLK